MKQYYRVHKFDRIPTADGMLEVMSVEDKCAICHVFEIDDDKLKYTGAVLITAHDIETRLHDYSGNTYKVLFEKEI